MLKEYGEGGEEADTEDPFPRDDSDSKPAGILRVFKKTELDLRSANRKALYKGLLF